MGKWTVHDIQHIKLDNEKLSVFDKYLSEIYRSASHALHLRWLYDRILGEKEYQWDSLYYDFGDNIHISSGSIGDNLYNIEVKREDDIGFDMYYDNINRMTLTVYGNRNNKNEIDEGLRTEFKSLMSDAVKKLHIISKVQLARILSCIFSVKSDKDRGDVFRILRTIAFPDHQFCSNIYGLLVLGNKIIAKRAVDMMNKFIAGMTNKLNVKRFGDIGEIKIKIKSRDFVPISYVTIELKKSLNNKIYVDFVASSYIPSYGYDSLSFDCCDVRIRLSATDGTVEAIKVSLLPLLYLIDAGRNPRDAVFIMWGKYLRLFEFIPKLSDVLNDESAEKHPLRFEPRATQDNYDQEEFNIEGSIMEHERLSELFKRVKEKLGGSCEWFIISVRGYKDMPCFEVEMNKNTIKVTSKLYYVSKSHMVVEYKNGLAEVKGAIHKSETNDFDKALLFLKSGVDKALSVASLVIDSIGGLLCSGI